RLPGDAALLALRRRAEAFRTRSRGLALFFVLDQRAQPAQSSKQQLPGQDGVTDAERAGHGTQLLHGASVDAEGEHLGGALVVAVVEGSVQRCQIEHILGSEEKLL